MRAMKQFLMLFALSVCTSLAAATVPKECEKLGLILYEELGCRPQYDNAQLCPSHYVCDEYKSDENTCKFQGRTYKKNEKLDDKYTIQSCSIGCYCNGRNKIRCAVLDCPEWLGVPIEPGCHRTYALDECCSTGSNCEPNATKCKYEGKTYKEGEKFYAEGRCYTCVCQAGFKGELEEPFCHRTRCGVEISHAKKIEENCAPVYAKFDSCCPIGYACPTNDEVIKSAKQTSDKKCKFGSKLLNVGDSFDRKLETYVGTSDGTCKCQMPPFVACYTSS